MICTNNPYQELLRAFFINLERKLIGEELWILAAFSGVVLLAVFVWVYNMVKTNQKKSFLATALFFVLTFMVVLIGQFPNFGRYNTHINEAQHIAEANVLVHNPVFWRDVDGTTIGPIPIYVLSIPGHFDLPIDYFTAKILNIILWLIIIIVLFKALRVNLSAAVSRFAILPLIVFVALFSDKDFVSYNGEVPTLVLLSVSIWIFFHLIKTGGKNHFLNFLLGILLTLVPFSKIQAGPVAVYIGIFYLMWILKNKNGFKPVIFLLSGVIVPVILIAGYLVQFDIWKDFYESYILNNLFYAGKGEGLAHNKGVVMNAVKFLFILFRGIEFRLFFSVFVLITLVWGFFTVRKEQNRRWGSILFGKTHKLFLTGLLLISAFVVYLPGNVFLHYALFLIPSIVLVTGYLWRGLLMKVDNSLSVSFFYLVICIIGPALIITFQGHPFFNEIRQSDSSGRNNEMAAFLCAESQRGDKLALWGWESTLYSDTGLGMATRESQTQRQILSWKQKNYYRSRYMKDLKKSRPRFFIDSTRKNKWIFKYSKHNFTTFPELHEYINNNYVFVAELDQMKLYELRIEK